MNKIVISQKNAWKILFFLCAIVALNVPGSIFYNDYSEKLVVLLGMIEIAITGLICVKSNKVNSLLATGVAEFVTPFFAVTVISCVSAAVIHQTSNVSDITQSFIRAIQIAAVFIIAYNAVKKFEKVSLDILLAAGCVSYATVVLCVISGKLDVSRLESHGFIEATGLLFIYYCLSRSYSLRQKLARCLLCATILLLGGKRVAWIGIAWSLFVYFLFFKIKERKDRIIKITMIVY